MQLFWRSSRAKRAAISTIAPLVENSRMQIGPIPDQLWRQPYMIGFLSTLVTLAAIRHGNGKLDSDQLGLTQLEAWSAITGLQDDQIGEDIQLLSAEADPSFVVGCNNAAMFDRVYNGETPGTVLSEFATGTTESATLEGLARNDLLHDAFTEDANGGALAAALWVRFFDDHINCSSVQKL